MDGMLSQEEINALLSGMNVGETDTTPSTSSDLTESGILTDAEIDVIGEISNISLGTSATTLSALVNQKVVITTPKVSVSTWSDLVEGYGRPCVFIQIYYKQGLEGNNILILKENDVKIIADLMMGGDGTNTTGELSELHLSAISEAMNQMMGSSSTSLSSLLNKKVDISPPVAQLVELHEKIRGEDIASFLKDPFIKVSFKMEIGNLVDSELMQLYPVEFTKDMYRTFTSSMGIGEITEAELNRNRGGDGMESKQSHPINMESMNGMPMGGWTSEDSMMNPQPVHQPSPVPEVNAKPAQFTPFHPTQLPHTQQENINLLKDVPLEVTVELGRTHKSIKEILEFAPGTIIELNRLAGEPIDVLVNGKYVAKGEVMVIEEVFGIRITEIVK